MQKDYKKYLKIAVIAIAALAAGIIYVRDGVAANEVETIFADDSSGNETEDNTGDNTRDTSNSGETKSTAENQLLIYVHVCGAVRNPGVYALSDGTRLDDAVKAAGGMLENARDDYVNLAAMASDGEKIYIPYEDEISDEQILELLTEQKQEDESQKLININTADTDKLMELPGIGSTKAAQIVKYREEYGKFSKIEDIMLVPGIKEGAYGKICDLICVE